jgi:CO dehydrogenase maturation factor
MVCGKGGAGKSAISILIGRVLAERYNVFIVDSDESNELLPVELGADPPQPLVEHLGGKKNIFKLEEIDMIKTMKVAREGIKLETLPNEYVSKSPEGIGLITIGKIRRLGEGCACPFNYLTRIFLKNLILEEGEVVVVDTDAGIEHVGRNVEEGCDGILAVADPAAESLTLANILKQTSHDLGKKFWLVINKSTPNTIKIVKRIAAEKGLEITGTVRFDEELFKSCMEGTRLRAKSALADVKDIVKDMRLI